MEVDPPAIMVGPPIETAFTVTLIARLPRVVLVAQNIREHGRDEVHRQCPGFAAAQGEPAHRLRDASSPNRAIRDLVDAFVVTEHRGGGLGSGPSMRHEPPELQGRRRRACMRCTAGTRSPVSCRALHLHGVDHLDRGNCAGKRSRPPRGATLEAFDVHRRSDPANVVNGFVDQVTIAGRRQLNEAHRLLPRMAGTEPPRACRSALPP